ncbi:MAG: hypothetical protein ACK4UT_07980 [Moraxellaceae bacterium]
MKRLRHFHPGPLIGLLMLLASIAAEVAGYHYGGQAVAATIAPAAAASQ